MEQIVKSATETRFLPNTSQNSSIKTKTQTENLVDDFELTKEDLSNFNASVTYGIFHLIPKHLQPWMYMIGPVAPAVLELAKSIFSLEKIPEISVFNPSLIAHNNTVIQILTQVTLPSLINPINWMKTFWKISLPGQAITRSPLTKKQLTRSLQGINACYKNLGTASTLEVCKNLAIHTINALVAVHSNYCLANMALENTYYFATAMGNNLPNWISACISKNTLNMMNNTCPAAKDFSGWNLLGLNSNPSDTFFNWKQSPWTITPFYWDNKRVFVCGDKVPRAF